MSRPTKSIVLKEEEQSKLQEWARRPKTAQRLALRARIVLGCAGGIENRQVARQGRTPSRRSPHREGCASGSADYADTGNDAYAGHALVDPNDGQGGGTLAIRRIAHLAGVLATAAPGRDLQAILRSMWGCI